MSVYTGILCIRERLTTSEEPVIQNKGSRVFTDTMQLFVRAQDLHTLEVSGQETVSQIKAKISSLEGISAQDQVLLLSGAPLWDESTLDHCGVCERSTLDVAVRLLGGKVHGSLARAGKVAKQEKKKKKTGRAKRRMQYNRRFVNVVPTFGKKKGPNANS
ncbi:unnamed protein product [Ranitomeya imitator]|uniref:Ubiquitin-like domain-containing protein n=1 Tax=Ranitomeya imitator TaxID=111125 RepID=A0ABN9MJI9_9NEOB|nr:unnamed protein product [Ranitomeya imitator]